LGSTAIEDQLQEEVETVLSDFIKTGIKVWVLTGDKTDTAKSIAFSCKLISHEFLIFEFNNKVNRADILNNLNKFLKEISDEKNSDKKFSLIVACDELNRIMSDEELKEKVKKLKIMIRLKAKKCI
jgi:magnesium-transporting ATPase (P-type)